MQALEFCVVSLLFVGIGMLVWKEKHKFDGEQCA